MADLHPTVEACISRSFCDATFAAAERRVRAIDYLMDHIHATGHSGPLEDCQLCREVHEAALNQKQHEEADRG